MIKLIISITLPLLLILSIGCASDEGPRELVILTHDSFDIGEEIILEFQQAHNATVVIQKGGSSGEVLNRAILEKGNPSANILYGIDNTFLTRGLNEGIFVKSKKQLINWKKNKYKKNSFVWNSFFISKRFINIIYNYDFFATTSSEIDKDLIHNIILEHYILLKLEINTKSAYTISLEECKAILLGSLIYGFLKPSSIKCFWIIPTSKGKVQLLYIFGTPLGQVNLSNFPSISHIITSFSKVETIVL